MTTHGLFVGIDGGGTKTDLALVDESGKLLTRVQGSTSNRAVVGPDASVAVLQSLIEKAVGQAGATLPIEAGWIGLAGADRPEDQELFQEALGSRFRNLRITNDAELVLSGNPGGIGIALIGGTGSIAFARNESGESGRSGGWGHLFGDEGSAYHLGIQALRAVAAATDVRGPATTLTDALLQHWHASIPQQLILRVYDSEVHKSDIAASAPVVVDAARSGDTIAQQILVDAGHDLAALVSSLLKRIMFETPPSIAMTGGLVLKTPEIRVHIADALSNEPCQSDFALIDDVAVSAARSLSPNALKGTP